jgi:hypothetical protein
MCSNIGPLSATRAAVFLPGSLQAKLFSAGSAEPDPGCFDTMTPRLRSMVLRDSSRKPKNWLRSEVDA